MTWTFKIESHELDGSWRHRILGEDPVGRRFEHGSFDDTESATPPEWMTVILARYTAHGEPWDLYNGVDGAWRETFPNPDSKVGMTFAAEYAAWEAEMEAKYADEEGRLLSRDW